MKVNLRFAALSGASEQQLRQAAQRLAAQGLRVSVSAWDGTRCDVLVADVGDTYGQHTVGLARRRLVKIVALTQAAASGAGCEGVLVADDPLENWVRALADILGASPQTLAADTPVEVTATACDEGLGLAAPAVQTPAVLPVPQPQAEAEPVNVEQGLCRLAVDASLMGRDLKAEVAGCTVVLAVSAGRILARSDADLALVRSHLAQSGWTFGPVAGEPMPGDAVSMSLDAFYVQGALAAADQFPAFPEGEVALTDWPDLGAAPEVIAALKVAKKLTRQAGSADAISGQTQIDARVVSACLWAFAASGLLQAAVPAGESGGLVATTAAASAPANRPSAATAGKLAKRFGLA